jgi:hypothetical protein
VPTEAVVSNNTFEIPVRVSCAGLACEETSTGWGAVEVDGDQFYWRAKSEVDLQRVEAKLDIDSVPTTKRVMTIHKPDGWTTKVLDSYRLAWFCPKCGEIYR